MSIAYAVTVTGAGRTRGSGTSGGPGRAGVAGAASEAASCEGARCEGARCDGATRARARARASLWLRVPSIFFAENAGGCCRKVPRKPWSAASIASRDGGAPGVTGPVVRPCASAVSVENPKRTTATYDLSLSLRNCASRVARPRTSARTPVAAGSSVPVWPILGSRSARRTRATTSCDVGPAGLSMISRPSIDRLLEFLEEQLPQLVDRPGDGAAGRVLVPAAAELLRDGADVDLALRPHADAVLVALVLLEEHARLNLLHRQRQVDQPLGVLVGAARLARHLVIEVDDRDPPGLINLHRAEHGAKQLQPAHVVAVVHVARDEHRVDARLERRAADVEGARRQAGVVKRSGVGQDREVDVRRDLHGKRNAERGH